MAAHGYLLMTNVPPSKWCAPLSERSQLIGRAVEADIRVPAEHICVSRRHAEIGCDDSGFWVQDLGSTSGTQVNGVQLQPFQKFRVTAGDRLWLGGLEMDVAGLSNPEDSVSLRNQPKDGDTVEIRRQKQTNATASIADWQRMLQELTPTELDIVLWMARGYTSPEAIASQLHRSKNTIRTHFNNIFHKLKIHSRDELLAMIRRSEAEIAGLPG